MLRLPSVDMPRSFKFAVRNNCPGGGNPTVGLLFVTVLPVVLVKVVLMLTNCRPPA